MNRCFGYPLRLLVTVISDNLLHLGGINTVREGTGLLWSKYRVFVDGPCSGISMLWAGIFFTFALSLIYQLPQKKIYIAIGGATLALIAGNVFRVIGLFLFECQILETTYSVHNLIGMGAYILSTGLIFLQIRKLGLRKTATKSPGIPESQSHNTKLLHSSVAVAFSVIMIIIISGLPLQTTNTQLQTTLWPSHLFGEELVPAELSPHEVVSFKHFPGAVARFETSKYRVILYHLTEPSRELHGRALCLEAAGFTVHFQEGFTDSDGHRWSCIKAENHIKGLPFTALFKEITFDSKGQSYSTISEWYWSVFLGKSTGPWLHYSLEEKFASD